MVKRAAYEFSHDWTCSGEIYCRVNLAQDRGHGLVVSLPDERRGGGMSMVGKPETKDVDLAAVQQLLSPTPYRTW